MQCVKWVDGKLCLADAGPTGLCEDHMPGNRTTRKRETVANPRRTKL